MSRLLDLLSPSQSQDMHNVVAELIKGIMESTTNQAELDSYQSFLDRFEPFIQEGTVKANQFEKNLKALKDDILKHDLN